MRSPLRRSLPFRSIALGAVVVLGSAAGVHACDPVQGGAQPLAVPTILSLVAANDDPALAEIDAKIAALRAELDAIEAQRHALERKSSTAAPTDLHALLHGLRSGDAAGAGALGVIVEGDATAPVPEGGRRLPLGRIASGGGADAPHGMVIIESGEGQRVLQLDPGGAETGEFTFELPEKIELRLAGIGEPDARPLLPKMQGRVLQVAPAAPGSAAGSGCTCDCCQKQSARTPAPGAPRLRSPQPQAPGAPMMRRRARIAAPAPMAPPAPPAPPRAVCPHCGAPISAAPAPSGRGAVRAFALPATGMFEILPEGRPCTPSGTAPAPESTFELFGLEATPAGEPGAPVQVRGMPPVRVVPAPGAPRAHPKRLEGEVDYY